MYFLKKKKKKRQTQIILFNLQSGYKKRKEKQLSWVQTELVLLAAVRTACVSEMNQARLGSLGIQKLKKKVFVRYLARTLQCT